MADPASPPFKRRPRSRLANTSLQPRDPTYFAPPISDTNPTSYSYRTELHNLFDTPLTTNSHRPDVTLPGSDLLPSDEERRCESYYRLGLLSDPKDPKSDTGVKLINISGMLYRLKVVDRSAMDKKDWEEEEEMDRLGRLAEARRAEVEAMDVKQRFKNLRSGATN